MLRKGAKKMLAFLIWFAQSVAAILE